jgi:putative SOS response-associated peptidase YedK
MCGRFVAASPPDELARYFGARLADPDIEQRFVEGNYNVAPTNEVLAVRAEQGHRRLVQLRWGLVPSWAADTKIGSRLINARSETVADKPAFRGAFARRRCIVPADAFYEWQKIPGQKAKQPFHIARCDGDPMAFAGLWERWAPKDADGRWLDDRRIETCTIVTTSANSSVAPIHDRMPVILAATRWDDWLDPGSDHDAVRSLLVPAPDGLLEVHPVSTAVNNVRNNGPQLVDPLPQQASA